MTDMTEVLDERFKKWVAYFAIRGRSKAESERLAARYACMNRRERRRFLGERGKKRDLPRLMKVPRG